MKEQAINPEWKRSVDETNLRRQKRLTSKPVLQDSFLRAKPQEEQTEEQQAAKKAEIQAQQQILLGLLGFALHVGPVLGLLSEVAQETITTPAKKKEPFSNSVQKGVMNFLARTAVEALIGASIVGIVAVDLRSLQR